MLYTILEIAEKKPGWKVATLRDVTGITTAEVSISETNQKGDLQWPGFKGFVEGTTIEGNLWKSPSSSKYSIFPPKSSSGAYTKRGVGSAAISAAQDTKRVDIAVAQDRKHDAIARAGAFRDSTLVTLASLRDQPFPTDEAFKAEWTRWVKYFLGKADEPFI